MSVTHGFEFTPLSCRCCISVAHAMHGATAIHHVSSKDVIPDLICATDFCAWFPFVLAMDFAAHVKFV